MIARRLTNSSNSPLRYPGGKGKITRFIGDVMAKNGIDGTYIEPFAGGAGIAVNLLLSNRVDKILINDLDEGVYNFWKDVTENPEWLMRMIKHVPFDYNDKPGTFSGVEYIRYWNSVKTRYIQNNYRDMRLKGFDFFMLNRMNVSGILKGGPIGGKQQDGTYNISSRFNKKTLLERITNLANQSSRIVVTSLEGSYLCERLSQDNFLTGPMTNAFVFVDPPYYVQGKNLYNSYAPARIHKLVADRLMREHPWQWVLTYDTAAEINKLYSDDRTKKFKYQITYSANKRGKFDEYMFASPGLKISSSENVHLESISTPE